MEQTAIVDRLSIIIIIIVILIPRLDVYFLV